MPSPDPAPTAGIRILLADDHTMFRQALRRLLEDHDGAIWVTRSRVGGVEGSLCKIVGNDLALTYTAIPEPSSFALLAAAAGGMAWRRRQKKRKAAASASNTDSI